jgi:hypothetical protein
VFLCGCGGAIEVCLFASEVSATKIQNTVSSKTVAPRKTHASSVRSVSKADIETNLLPFFILILTKKTPQQHVRFALEQQLLLGTGINTSVTFFPLSLLNSDFLLCFLIHQR